jgi:hypothetical protein
MFTSPHPSSPWATLDASSFVYDGASPAASSSSAWSDNEDDEAVAVPTLFFKPAAFKARVEIDYFSFQPHGVRSPYLPESYGRLEEEAIFEFDEDELAAEEDDDAHSTASSSVGWDATPEDALGPAFVDDDNNEATPVHIERVSVFDLSPPALSALSSSASSSSSSLSSSVASIRTPLASLSVSPPKHVAPSMSLATAVGSLVSSRWQEKAVHADTPHPNVVESPGATTALFDWRRE